MSDDLIDGKPPTTFWIAGGAALIWNLFGLWMYVSTVTATPESYAQQGFTPEQIDFINATAAWSTGAFAIAVNAGALAALFMLLRKAWAVPTFLVSLIAILILDIYNFVLRDTIGMFGMGAAYMQGVIFVIAVLQVVYSRHARNRKWLT